MIRPKLLEIQLTGRCNLSCVYCGNSPQYTNSETIQLNMALKAINELDPQAILFTGGEVYLGWNTLLKILDALDDNRFQYILSSNLSLIKAEEIDLLIDKYKFKTFHTSFNDLDQAMTEKVRGGTAVQRNRIMDNIQHITSRNMTLKVETILLPDTIHYLYEINALLYSLGVRHHKLEFLIPVGHADSHLPMSTEVILNNIYDFIIRKQNDSLIEITCLHAAPCFHKHKIFDLNRDDVIFHKCVDGKETAYLLANGTMLPCFLFPDKECQINVNTHNLLTEWNSHPIFKGMRSINKDCSECEFFHHNAHKGKKVCNNGCNVWNYINTRSFANKISL